jgi:acyl-CoA thioester hydrolase
VREYVLTQRVYYEDTDVGGLVYHANYLRYMERARSELLRASGVDQKQLLGQRIQFTVVDMQIAWLRPARYDDLLCIIATVQECRGASMLFAQRIHRDDREGELLVQATVRAAALNADTLRPIRLPTALVAGLDT